MYKASSLTPVMLLWPHEFTFMNSMKCGSSFMFLDMAIQFSQPHLLKRFLCSTSCNQLCWFRLIVHKSKGFYLWNFNSLPSENYINSNTSDLVTSFVLFLLFLNDILNQGLLLSLHSEIIPDRSQEDYIDRGNRTQVTFCKAAPCHLSLKLSRFIVK